MVGSDKAKPCPAKKPYKEKEGINEQITAMRYVAKI
jgi:hypothetical protein